MELLVQQFLKTHTFKELQENHGVYTSFSKSGHKFSLNYSQLETKEDDILAQDCRGLILSLKDGSPILGSKDDVVPGNTKIIAYPLKRFFNFGQGSAANIDWSDPNLAILEKLDGSLLSAYFDPFTSEWCVSTRSVPEADLIMDNGIFTFRTLFEKAVMDTLGLTFDLFTKSLVKEMTYCFELTTPYNRIVVKYDTCRITLLAARYLPTLQEVNPHTMAIVEVGGVPCVQAYAYTSVSELVDWVSTLNPMEHEGVVVRDSNFNRIKVKNPAYVAASKIRESLATSPRNCLELILLGKDDDAASFLPPEIQANLASLKEKFVLWLKAQEVLAQELIAEAKSIAPDKKTFALTVQKRKPDMPSALFHIYDGKANSIRSFIDNNRKEGTWSNSFIDKILSVI